MAATAPLLPSLAILGVVFYACLLLWRVQLKHEIKLNKTYVFVALIYIGCFALELSLFSSIMLKFAEMQRQS